MLPRRAPRTSNGSGFFLPAISLGAGLLAAGRWPPGVAPKFVCDCSNVLIKFRSEWAGRRKPGARGGRKKLFEATRSPLARWPSRFILAAKRPIFWCPSRSRSQHAAAHSVSSDQRKAASTGRHKPERGLRHMDQERINDKVHKENKGCDVVAPGLTRSSSERF